MAVRSSRRGMMSATDLLVVIAIIAILIALLLPAIGSARASARRSVCMANARQLGLAALSHQEATRRLPPSAFGGDGSAIDVGLETIAPGSTKGKTQAPYSLTTKLLPYIEQGHIYESIDFEKPAFDDGHAALAATVIPILACPSYSGTAHSAAEDYAAETKPALSQYKALGATTWGILKNSDAVSDPKGDGGAIQPYATVRSLRAASQTILLCETREPDYAAWFDGTTAAVPGFHPEIDDKKATTPAVNYRTKQNPIFFSKKSFGGSGDMIWGPSSEHPGGAIHVMADTAVHFISNDIAPKVYKALITRKDADNKDIGEFFFQ